MSHRRRTYLLGAATLAAGLFASACSSSQGSNPARSSSSSTTSSASSSTSPAFRYQPLYPFASPTEVSAWQTHDAGRDDEAWHLDAKATALSFTKFLGYTEIDRTGTTTGDTQDAHVQVGSRNPDGRFSAAAVVHLVRYGRGDHVPWEVVGTDDTDFSLTTPVYGASVTSPLPVGGRVSGVDESISVTVRGLHAPVPLGAACCVPAGGEGTPWSTTVSFVAPVVGVIVIGAATGGHVQEVERFTVTAATTPTR